MDPIPRSARAKIERAAAHRDALSADIGEWVREVQSAGGPTGWLEVSPDRRSATGLSNIPEPDTKAWALILGDLFHNLRSSLDHVIAHFSPEEEQLRCQFPICTDEAGFRKNGRRRITGLDSARQQRVEELQPFRMAPGEADFHALRLLSDFDNADKHRLLHVLIISPTKLETSATFAGDDAKDVQFGARLDEVVTFDEIGRARWGELAWADTHDIVSAGVKLDLRLAVETVHGPMLLDNTVNLIGRTVEVTAMAVSDPTCGTVTGTQVAVE